MWGMVYLGCYGDAYCKIAFRLIYFLETCSMLFDLLNEFFQCALLSSLLYAVYASIESIAKASLKTFAKR